VAKAGVSRAWDPPVLVPERHLSRARFESGKFSFVPESTVNVRYMVDDVDAAVAFYTTHFGFMLRSNAAPAFADVVRGSLRLLLSGPKSSAGRPMPDGRKPGPGGWNRIHFVVEDIESEVARLRTAGVRFRSDIISGPGGKQIVLDDPSGNPIELFQPSVL
jgi:catechol 2,3-dioxygenase-like lactoylglutathione lyase family enzyme